MYLHQNISYLREAAGLTNNRFGEEVGISHRTAYEIEHKESEATRLLTVMKVAEYFGVSLDDLVYKYLRRKNKEMGV